MTAKTTAKTAEKEMDGVFEDIGNKHGYGIVRARYVALKDFKVRWTRVANRDWVDFEVSDYIKGAHPDLIASLAETIFSKMEGGTVPYSDAFSKWALSEDFVEEKQPVYLSRCRNLTRTPEGKYKDLSVSFQRLKDMGLVDKDSNPYITWTTNKSMRKCGYSSPLMNVIVISSYFDGKEIPDSLLDYVVYGEWLRMSEKRKCFGHEIDNDYVNEMMTGFPESDQSKRLLDKFRMYI